MLLTSSCDYAAYEAAKKAKAQNEQAHDQIYHRLSIAGLGPTTSHHSTATQAEKVSQQQCLDLFKISLDFMNNSQADYLSWEQLGKYHSGAGTLLAAANRKRDVAHAYATQALVCFRVLEYAPK